MTRRFIVNNDFYNIFQVKPPVTDRDIHDAVDKLVASGDSSAGRASQVDTLFLMADHSYTPTVAPEIARLYDHPHVDPCINSLTELKASGKDPWGMVLRRAKQKGLDFFASFRMNDTHYLDHPYHPWVPQFYYDNLHNRVTPSLSIEPNNRRDTEFDYRKSVIRDYYERTIRGVVERYDVDGIELDFTRNCRFFPEPHREECAPVMTEFVRKVRVMLDEIAKSRGAKGKGKGATKRIELAVTIPHSLYGARLEGLDVTTWARLGLIDLVGMSTPFLVDTGRDIADTVMKLGGVPVYPACDRNFAWPARPLPKEAYRALAMAGYAQGAAGFYAYNVMHWTMRLEEPPESLKVAGGGSLTLHDACLMSELGSPDTLERLDKLYLVSAGKESADRPYMNLPVTVPANGEVTLRVFIGDDIAKAAMARGAIERIEVQAISSDCDEYNNYTLKLNGIDLARQYAFTPYANKPESRFLFPEPENKQPPVPVEKVRRHPARAVDLHKGVNYVTIKSWKNAMTVTDVEIAIVYKK